MHLRLRHGRCFAVEREGPSVMTEAHKILIVAPTTTLASKLHRWLGDAGYELTVVTTFVAAKAHLRTSSPDLVVTQVRLAEYNGLQLALYARANSIPTIVIGEPDPIVERDASQFGATYLRSEEVSRERILALTARAISGADPAPSSRHAPSSHGSDPGILPRDAAGAAQDAAVVSDVEWVVAPEIMRPRSAVHPRRLTLH